MSVNGGRYMNQVHDVPENVSPGTTERHNMAAVDCRHKYLNGWHIYRISQLSPHHSLISAL